MAYRILRFKAFGSMGNSWGRERGSGLMPDKILLFSSNAPDFFPPENVPTTAAYDKI